MADNNDPTCTLLFWKVPRELKDKFKAITLRKGTSMRREILKLIEKYVRANTNA